MAQWLVMQTLKTRSCKGLEIYFSSKLKPAFFLMQFCIVMCETFPHDDIYLLNKTIWILLEVQSNINMAEM